MKERYVVDTNVLIAASAVVADSPAARDATPHGWAMAPRVTTRCCLPPKRRR